MKAVIIDNQVRLVKYDSNRVTIKVTLPMRNIQRMKEKTDCYILAVEKTRLPFHHLAGQVAIATISVRIGAILPYMQTASARDCINAADYARLLQINPYNLNYEYQKLPSDAFRLYAFGDLSPYTAPNTMTTYRDAKGVRISLHRNENYVKKFGRWFSKENKK